MCTRLREFADGDNIPAYDEDVDTINLSPENLDIDKFNRGREFFRRHIGQCLTAMLYSLTCGLSIKQFLDVLVCTGKTSTPMTSITRYLNTTVHVIKWHYGNVWDSTSKSYQSIISVRRMHKMARKLMTDQKAHSNVSSSQCNENGDNKHVGSVYLSQYDMGLVQCGFMGAIIMYPDKFGISCSKEDLDDYVYFWRWIGYLLGIDDKYNICMGGYDTAYSICRQIDTEILIRSLNDPPRNFYPMAKAFTDGMQLMSYVPLYTVESIVARYYHASNVHYPYPVSLANWFRIYSMRLYMSLMYYFPSFASLVNSGIERAFQCHKFSDR